MDDKETKKYFNFSNVETMENTMIPEEFPEGPFGSSIRKNNPVENKSTPWREGQRTYSAYNYEFKSLHQNLPRQMEGAHPPHDDPTKNEEPPYTEQ
ncbi:cytosolic protein [Bacillus sp. V3B]|uniref:cytosolic protein n=1 Tax=Bacillus sp. V3B TaxID=2804915 RepID=UPI00210D79B7|nr:cytosolic protein [Bacillus sp. V3B]MCQ6276550.1 cytosolic protein [Bacillus sp. V3B]